MTLCHEFSEEILYNEIMRISVELKEVSWITLERNGESVQGRGVSSKLEIMRVLARLRTVLLRIVADSKNLDALQFRYLPSVPSYLLSSNQS